MLNVLHEVGSMSTFKERFLLLKIEKNLTLTEIAESTRTSASTLSRILSGKYQLKQDLIESLARYFSVDQSYLLGESNVRHHENTIPPDMVEVCERAYKEGIPAQVMTDMIEFYLKNRHR